MHCHLHERRRERAGVPPPTREHPKPKVPLSLWVRFKDALQSTGVNWCRHHNITVTILGSPLRTVDVRPLGKEAGPLAQRLGKHAGLGRRELLADGLLDALILIFSDLDLQKLKGLLESGRGEGVREEWRWGSGVRRPERNPPGSGGSRAPGSEERKG